MTQIRSAWIALVILALAPGLRAQAPMALGESPERYAQVKVLEGNAIIHKGEQDEALGLGVPVAEGDAVESQGRGILQLGDGSRVAFERGTRFQVAELFADAKGVREVLLKLEVGRLRIRMGASSGARVRVDTPAGAGTLENRADASFQAADDQSLQHWVTEGRTGFANHSGRTLVRAGEQLQVAGGQDALDRITDFNTFDQDDFDTWCNPLLNVPRSPSAARVPPEIRYYADDLDGQGDWNYVSECGTWCWCPAGLPAYWRPYWDGRWACYPGGLTWISAEPWGYVTHHFGRWGWNTGLGWYWIPGIYYSPAWVAWNTSDVYFAWAPLGFYNLPVVWGYGPWAGGYAWTVVNINFINAANVRPRAFTSAAVVGTLSRSGTLSQGRMLVTPAEFRNPAQIQQVARQRTLLQQRTAAYAQAVPGRALVPAQASAGRFESSTPAPQPLLRVPDTTTFRPSASQEPSSAGRPRQGETSGSPWPAAHTAPSGQVAPPAHVHRSGGSGHHHPSTQAGEARPARGEGEPRTVAPREEARPAGGMGRGGELKPH